MRTLPSLVSLLPGAMFLALAAFAAPGPTEAQPPVPKDQPVSGQAEPTPPAGQTYIGVIMCASCHFEKYTDWKKQQDKHVKAFDILPDASKADPNCLGCHVTGFGRDTGFKTVADKGLIGVTCEACHGPGSGHADIAKVFAYKKPISPENDKLARDSIYRILPDNACVRCHTNRSHRNHPEYPKAAR